MYKIYAEEMAVTASKLCIYHDAENLESICLPDPKLTMEDNSAGQLTLTMPPANAGYDSVNRLTTTLTVYKDDVEIWSGRVISEDMDFWNQRSLTCEGELAFLNDSIQPPEEYQIESTECVRQFLVNLIDIHNAQVDTYKQFEVGTVSVHDSNGYLYKYTNYNTTWDCIQEKLLDTYGGHLVITKGSDGKRTLNYYDSYPGTSSQRIEFGKNLLDFTKSWDMTDFATVILPRGAQLDTEVVYDDDGNIVSGQEEYYEALIPYTNLENYTGSQAVKDENGNTLGYIRTRSGDYYARLYGESSRYLGQYVINEVAVSNYGWIALVVDWSDVTVESYLWDKALAYIEDIQFDNLELEMNAIDLHYLGADYETINLLDQVAVLSRPHGLVGTDGNGKLFPVSKMEIPLNDPENSTFTFGDKVTTTITGSTRSTSSEILARIENMKLPSKSNEATVLLQQAITEAQKNANDMIARATEGYITIVYDQDLMFPDSRSQAIYISNTENYTEATDFWVWNSGGLAHYSKTRSQAISEATMGIRNADGTITALPNVALGMDGSIYASYITAGVITADLITAGTLVDASGGKYFYLDVSHGQLFIGQGDNLSNSVSNAGSSYIAMVGPWTVNASSLYYKNSTVSSTPSSTSSGPYIYFGTDGLNLAWSSHAYMRVQSGQLTAFGADIITSNGTFSTEMEGGYLKFYFDTRSTPDYGVSSTYLIGGIHAITWLPNQQYANTTLKALDISSESNGNLVTLGGVSDSSGTYIVKLLVNSKGTNIYDSSGNSYGEDVIVFGTLYTDKLRFFSTLTVELYDNNGWSQSSSSSAIPAILSINIGGAKVSYAGNSDTATKLATSRKITISSSSGNAYANFDGSGDITLYIGSLLSSSYTHPDPFSIGTLTVTTAFTVKGTSSANSVDVDLYGTVSIGSNSQNANNFQCYALSYFYRNTYLAHQGSSSVYCDGPFHMTSTATSNNYHLTIHSKNDTWWMCLGSRDRDDDTIIGFAYGDTTTDNKLYYFYYAEHSSSGLDSYFCGDTVHLGNTTSTTLIYIGNSNVTSNNIYGQYIYMGYSTHTKYVYIGHASSDSSLYCYTYIYGHSVYVGYNGYTNNIYMGYPGYTYVYIDGYDISIGDSSRCYRIYIGYNTSSLHSYLYGGEVYIGYNSNCSLVRVGYAVTSCTVMIKGAKYDSSDVSLKSNIQELSIKSMTPLNIIDNITPISYIFTDGRQHYGYSANEVLDACGGEYGIVIKDDSDGYLMMSYNDLIPLLHLKIKQLEKRIEELESLTIIEEDD